MQQLISYLIAWLILAIVVGLFARNYRGRSGFGWFLLAIILSPLLAFLLAAVTKRIEPNTRLAIEVERESDQQYFEAFRIGFVVIVIGFIFVAAASGWLH